MSLLAVTQAGIASAQTTPPASGTNQPAAELWVTNQSAWPPHLKPRTIRTNEFESLHAEAIAGKVKILWPQDTLPASAGVTLFASQDDPGHWPARDWRPYAMTKRGTAWEAWPPADHLDVRLVYWLQVSNANSVTFSPMRALHPRALGLEQPTRPFWPFLEGFEEQLESWRLVDPRNAAKPLAKGTPAKNGKTALCITLAEGKKSVTIATERVRGWQVMDRSATGLRLWLRTKTGEGKARFTLLAHAQSDQQMISIFPADAALNTAWQKIDLPFASFANLSREEIDRFTIEFIGEGPLEFLADDLQLLGSWTLIGN